MRTDNLIWQHAFFGIAFMAAMRSKDPSTQCGACIVRENRPLGWGYNGFVIGTEDVPEKWESQEKLNWVVHAERNAILNSYQAGSSDLSGAEMYIWTSSPDRVYLPCKDCARTIAQCHVSAIHVSADLDALRERNQNDSRWGTEIGMEIMKNAGVKIHYYDSVCINRRLLMVAEEKLS